MWRVQRSVFHRVSKMKLLVHYSTSCLIMISSKVHVKFLRNESDSLCGVIHFITVTAIKMEIRS